MASAPPLPVAAPALPPSLLRLFAAFLRLGATAFGGPAMVAYIRRMAVERNRWLPPQAFDDGVALCQVIPGATAMQTAAYVGLRVRGVRGAATSFIGFGLPAFAAMLVLSVLYAVGHGLPVVVALFGGLRALVVALIASALLSFGASSIRHWSQLVLAALAATAYVLGVNPVLVILVAAGLGWAFLPRLPAISSEPARSQLMQPTVRPVASILAAAAAGLVLLWFADRRLASLTALMLRIDLFAFGGGFASVPLMYHEIVDVRHWLSGAALADGIALGQVTPGPIVITATFVGHQLGGLTGGALATIGVFLPSFLMVVAIAPHFERLRRSALFGRMIAGVLCSFVGLLLAVALRLAQSVAWTWAHALLTLAAFVALRLKVDVLWVVAGGALLSLALGR